MKRFALIPVGAALALTTLAAALAAKPAHPTHIVDALDGPAISDVAPKGRSVFHANAQNSRYRVHVAKVGMPGATLDVVVDGTDVGDIVLNEDGVGNLLLRSRAGDTVPAVTDASVIEVRNQADGAILLDNVP